MTKRFLGTAAFLLLFAASSGASEQESTGSFLTRAKEAAGGAAWNHKEALHSELEVEASGLAGTAEAWEELATGRAATHFKLGPVEGAMGYDGERAWTRDEAGDVQVSDARDDLETAANEAYIRSLAYFFPERWPAKLEPPRSERDGDERFTVIAATPQGGRRLELWFDAETLLLARLVDRGAQEVRTTWYSDYRTLDGVKVAYVQRSSTGSTASEQHTRVTGLEFVPAIEPALLVIPKSKADDFTIAGDATSFSLPFELANNHIYVTARFNGGEPRRVMVDTGGANLLTQEAAKALGLVAQGAIEARGSGEKKETVQITKVGKLVLGPLTLQDQTFFVFPIDYMKSVEGVEFAGLVGFEVFKRFVVTLDYAGRKLTLTRPEAFTHRGKAQPLPFSFDDRTPQIEGSLDGISGLFSLDTGSRSSLTLHAPFARQHNLAAKLGSGRFALTGWGVGGGVRSELGRAKELTLGVGEGAVSVKRPVVELAQVEQGAFADPHLAGNIGGGVLKRFTVTFDYGRKLLYLEPNANFAKEDPYDRAGLWINQAENGFSVEDVVAGSPADEAGFRVGDLVTKVGGRLAASFTLSELRQALRTNEVGNEVRFTFVRAGQSSDVTIKLRDLF